MQIMDKGYTCVTPYLICNKWPDPSSKLRNQQSGPVTVAVECKLNAAGPLMSDGSKYFRQVILIEGVPCINEEEPTFLLLGVLFPLDTRFGSIHSS